MLTARQTGTVLLSAQCKGINGDYVKPSVLGVIKKSQK